MRKFQINKAIAQHAGWSPCPKYGCTKHWRNPAGVEADLPNFCEDLNAMHKVEKRLSLDERHGYYQRLWHICDREHRMASVGEWLVPTATAAQRAEAFLRTVGKWMES